MKRKEVYKTKRRYSYGEFLILLPCCSEIHRTELLHTLEKTQCPKFLCGKELPENLNAVSYGLLDDLRSAVTAQDPVAESLHLILGLDIKDIYKANVCDIFGFVNFLKSELEKINKLFSSLKVNYSNEEISAGVKDLDFGSFGVLDWYARRMGITNQNEVRDVAWVRIYNCMKNDTEQNNYERRLNKQYIRKK